MLENIHIKQESELSMENKVDNAVIMAAGTASRFAPLSFEKPKALIEVRGEILIERQIRQLLEVGIKDIILVVGYRKEAFDYLKDKYSVKIVENKEYLTRNNNSSIYAVRDFLKNTYICSSDNYFIENPFEEQVEEAYYSSIYVPGKTDEWCIYVDENDYIKDVKIGGENAWVMMGHTFWSKEFSNKFINILESVYHKEETKDLLWESILIDHLQECKMKIRKYSSNVIFEFDTLDELRKFDSSYVKNTRSSIIKNISTELKCMESDIADLRSIKDFSNESIGFSFRVNEELYEYRYTTREWKKVYE